ncbi:glycosyl transferase family 1 [Ammoniphilus oxalaticus]|uniref:Glycosyl transferase family 1 n=1 Tax=Ammoniphilus oxalaticus TaxID=66863 RepID=A0A419SHA9_9BACL|nr:glycosyltransferase family 1 protein [Ammoniphilus oxalaticus]RKD23168.1 glycosyl transferase family 1 [Ammoniphilus oxalaticus]
MDKKKRVLHVVSAMNRGGAETLLMNVYRNIDRDRIQFDFVSHRSVEGDFDREICQLGGKIYRVKSLGQSGLFSYISALRGIMVSEEYAAVHAHTDYQAGFPLLAAKRAGIKRRICHSHSNHFPKGNRLKERALLKVLQMVITRAATDYCACSQEAAQFLYGNRQGVHLLKNGIDIDSFLGEMEPPQARSVRQELGIPTNAKLIGHIGHFSPSKNHSFMLRLLKELVTERSDIFLILVGGGPLREEIEGEARRLGVDDHVRFLGVRSDAPRLMKAFDVFLFPSIYEGFGIVAIEAQSAGTPCIIADSVPKSVDMGLGLVSFVSLQDSLAEWTKQIHKAFLTEQISNEAIVSKISSAGFDIKQNVSEWLGLYG